MDAESEQAVGRAGAQSIRRAVNLLQIVAAGRDTGLSLSTIVQLSGLTRPTAHRMLVALAASGLVERKPKSRRYAIGEQVQLLALARSRKPALLSGAEAILQEAAHTLGDTLFLALRAGHDTVCIARHLGSFPVQVLALEVGERRPLGSSSAGVAILAGLAADEAADIVSQNASRLPSRERLIAEIEESRGRGYAFRSPGLLRGTAALSAPIRAPDGSVAGAITVAAVRRRLSTSDLPTVAPAVLEYAHAIERALIRPIG